MNFKKTVKKDLIHYLFPLDKKKDIKLRGKHMFLALLSIEFRLVLSYRIQNYLWNKKFKKISYLLYLRSKWKYKCDIYPSATIGAGLRIGHCSDIVIGPEVIIGCYAIIFNGVTIGKRSVGKIDFMPSIGNNVVIGTGAKLLGGISVSDDVIIGANSVVNRNVKRGITVVGAPAIPVNEKSP